MRIIGIDYGSKRVGIAVSDVQGTIAFPKVVLPNNAALSNEIVKIIEESGAERVVIGESKNNDGASNAINAEMIKFKKELREKIKIPIALEPEFLSSFEAARYTGEGDMLDASAAAIILQRYLEKLILTKHMNSEDTKKKDGEGKAGPTAAVGPAPLPSPSTISYDDFKKIEIKIGKILSAEKVPDTDKLLRLSVDFGGESPRQIVSGISAYFPDPAVLVGMKVAFAFNLAPRKIRGLESQGMILAVGGDDKPFSLLSVKDDVVSGSTVN